MIGKVIGNVCGKGIGEGIENAHKKALTPRLPARTA